MMNNDELIKRIVYATNFDIDDEWEQSIYDVLMECKVALSKPVDDTAIMVVIDERDHVEDVLDKVLDLVLGNDRTEWSSTYSYDNAINDVEERIKASAWPSGILSADTIERCAKVLFDASPSGHKTLAAAGFPITWEEQGNAVRRDYINQTKAVLNTIEGVNFKSLAQLTHEIRAKLITTASKQEDLKCTE